jgi:CRISPR-associated protein Csm2
MPNHRPQGGRGASGGGPPRQRPQEAHAGQENPLIRQLQEEFKRVSRLNELTRRLEDFVKYSEELARSREMADLNPTQLRRVFSELRRIVREYRHDGNTQQARSDLLMLRPKLAYAAGRKVMPDGFYQLMRTALTKIQDGSDMEFLDKFLTAFLAYFKYYSEQKNQQRRGRS